MPRQAVDCTHNLLRTLARLLGASMVEGVGKPPRLSEFVKSARAMTLSQIPPLGPAQPTYLLAASQGQSVLKLKLLVVHTQTSHRNNAEL